MKNYLREAIEMAGEYGEKADKALSQMRWGWIGKIVAVILWFILTGWLEAAIISAVLFPLRLADSSLQLYYSAQQPLRWCVCCGLRLPLFLIPLFFYFRWKRNKESNSQDLQGDGQ
jgi:hypothetical protein